VNAVLFNIRNIRISSDFSMPFYRPVLISPQGEKLSRQKFASGTLCSHANI